MSYNAAWVRIQIGNIVLDSCNAGITSFTAEMDLKKGKSFEVQIVDSEQQLIQSGIFEKEQYAEIRWGTHNAVSPLYCTLMYEYTPLFNQNGTVITLKFKDHSATLATKQSEKSIKFPAGMSDTDIAESLVTSLGWGFMGDETPINYHDTFFTENTTVLNFIKKLAAKNDFHVFTRYDKKKKTLWFVDPFNQDGNIYRYTWFGMHQPNYYAAILSFKPDVAKIATPKSGVAKGIDPVTGQPISIESTEKDQVTSPYWIGIEKTNKMIADKEGKLTSATSYNVPWYKLEMSYFLQVPKTSHQRHGQVVCRVKKNAFYDANEDTMRMNYNVKNFGQSTEYSHRGKKLTFFGARRLDDVSEECWSNRSIEGETIQFVDEDSKDKLLKHMRGKARAVKKASMEVLGNPYLAENEQVYLINLAPTFDGLWAINKVKHKIEVGHGYTTSIDLERRNPNKKTVSKGSKVDAEGYVEINMWGMNLKRFASPTEKVGNQLVTQTRVVQFAKKYSMDVNSKVDQYEMIIKDGVSPDEAKKMQEGIF